jgi:hypothetical protein
LGSIVCPHFAIWRLKISVRRSAWSSSTFSINSFHSKATSSRTEMISSAIARGSIKPMIEEDYLKQLEILFFLFRYIYTLVRHTEYMTYRLCPP